LNTIHITGQSAKTAPLATLSRARPGGMPQTAMAITSPTTRPASEACQAGRRATPSSTRTVAMGSAAITKERTRLPPTGVSN